jgi:hypothetical protein
MNDLFHLINTEREEVLQVSGHIHKSLKSPPLKRKAHVSHPSRLEMSRLEACVQFLMNYLARRNVSDQEELCNRIVHWDHALLLTPSEGPNDQTTKTKLHKQLQENLYSCRH